MLNQKVARPKPREEESKSICLHTGALRKSQFALARVVELAEPWEEGREREERPCRL